MRKSSEAKEKQALSIPAQMTGIKEIFPNLNIVRWTEEKASAFIAENRPEFDGTLERLKKGEIDGIVSWQPNRLSRNALEAGKITHYINTGIIKDIKFATYTFENTPEGVKALQYALADAQFYSASLGRDVKRGNKEKRNRGWLTTANLNGYMNVKNPNQGENDPVEHITAIDPERFPLIRKAWDLFLTGEYTVPMILDILNNQWGYRTRQTRGRKSRPLCKTALYNIFGNVKYAGKIPNPINGELLNGVYLAMVSIDEYNKAQEILGNRGRCRIAEKKGFAYKGIAVCGECGCCITAEQKRGGRYIYYHCTHKRKDYICKQPSIEEASLIRQLKELFDSITIRKEFEEWGLEAIRSMNAEESNDRKIILESQTNALKEAENKADRLLDLVANGTITENQYQRKITETEDSIKSLRKELDETLNSSGDWRDAMRKTLDILFNGRNRFENGDIFAKREVLQSLGSNITIKDKKLHIDTYKWLEPIKNHYKTLETEFHRVRTADLQIKTDPFEPVRSSWQGILDEVRKMLPIS